MTTLGYTLPGPHARLIHADVAPEILGRTFPATIAVAADATEVVAALLAVPGGDPARERLIANARDRADYEAGSTPPSQATVAELVDPALVMAELRRQLPPEAIVTTDAGNFWGWAARYLRFRQPHTLLSPTSGAMGYAVPAAVAAALVMESRVPVVALAGDGGFLMTGAELAVAAQLGLRLLCVVFDNALYGTIRLHQERSFPGRVSGTELWSPDLVRYAEAFGGIGIRVERNEDIGEAVQTALAHPGISLLSIAMDREAIAVGTSLSAIAAG
jgi:acetolactate synthase-1/2/3 large subunit